MERTLKFKTDKATDWYITKEFADDKHMRNFIAYVCRTKKGYTLDEVFINQTEYKTCDRCCYDIVDNDGDIMEHVCTDEIELNSREDNKLIAEFMGMKYSDEKSFNNGEWTHSIKSLSKFETSWDWLMPVVEKISDAKSWSINATLEWLSESQDRDGFYDRDGIFQSVVEFINQLNR